MLVSRLPKSTLVQNTKEIEIKCIACLVREKAMCACIDTVDLGKFSQKSLQKEYNEGSFIFAQGEKNNFFYVLIEGSIKIFKTFDDGRTQIIGFLLPGDFFGFNHSDNFSYSAQCSEEVKCCVFSHTDLGIYLDTHPKLSKELMNMATRELSLMQERLADMGRLSARERIINFFLGISAQRKKIGLEENPISLPMSRSDIADYLGLTVETISREITKLKSEKIINMINSRQVFLNNKDTLEIQHLNNTTSY